MGEYRRFDKVRLIRAKGSGYYIDNTLTVQIPHDYGTYVFTYKHDGQSITKTLIIKEKMNKLTIDGVEIELTTEQVEKLRESICKPKTPTWEGLCRVTGWYVNEQSEIKLASTGLTTTTANNRNIWPTRELAEASLALAQLCQLRDHYNDGWQPDWSDTHSRKYVIKVDYGVIVGDWFVTQQHVMSFKSAEIRDRFMEEQSALLDIAKPLL
jgi:hypothetical protein